MVDESDERLDELRRVLNRAHAPVRKSRPATYLVVATER